MRWIRSAIYLSPQYTSFSKAPFPWSAAIISGEHKGKTETM